MSWQADGTLGTYSGPTKTICGLRVPGGQESEPDAQAKGSLGTGLPRSIALEPDAQAKGSLNPSLWQLPWSLTRKRREVSPFACASGSKTPAQIVTDLQHTRQ